MAVKWCGEERYPIAGDHVIYALKAPPTRAIYIYIYIYIYTHTHTHTHTGFTILELWRRVRIPPPQSLRDVRGDKKGTQSQMRR
jgi:hypothetical protein